MPLLLGDREKQAYSLTEVRIEITEGFFRRDIYAELSVGRNDYGWRSIWSSYGKTP